MWVLRRTPMPHFHGESVIRYERQIVSILPTPSISSSATSVPAASSPVPTSGSDPTSSPLSSEPSGTSATSSPLSSSTLLTSLSASSPLSSTASSSTLASPSTSSSSTTASTTSTLSGSTSSTSSSTSISSSSSATRPASGATSGNVFTSTLVVTSPNPAASSGSSLAGAQSSSSGLSAGAKTGIIVGAVVGGVAGLVLMVWLGLCCVRQRKSSHRRSMASVNFDPSGQAYVVRGNSLDGGGGGGAAALLRGPSSRAAYGHEFAGAAAHATAMNEPTFGPLAANARGNVLRKASSRPTHRSAGSAEGHHAGGDPRDLAETQWGDRLPLPGQSDHPSAEDGGASWGNGSGSSTQGTAGIGAGRASQLGRNPSSGPNHHAPFQSHIVNVAQPALPPFPLQAYAGPAPPRRSLRGLAAPQAGMRLETVPDDGNGLQDTLRREMRGDSPYSSIDAAMRGRGRDRQSYGPQAVLMQPPAPGL